MVKADVVVVGGSAAGVSAALTARRHYPDSGESRHLRDLEGYRSPPIGT